MEKNKIVLISLLCFIFGSALAQNKYLILLKDKNNSPFSIDRPQEFLSARSIERRTRQKIKVNQRDLPPNPAYINQIKATGSKIWYQSRWLNAVLIETSPTILNTILALPFVKGIEGNGDIRNARMAAQSNTDFIKNKLEVLETPVSYGNSFNQIEMLGVDKMHDAGFKGEGMLIGVFDSGFLNANKVPFLSSLFTENRILKTWDFVTKESNVYDDHNHGLNVLSCIAGVADGQLIGTAPKANFVLFKTEDVASETRIEEANWLFAAEMADSIGVDVVNSSLGYYAFDNPAQDYKKTDLNGNKALVTRAADWLASTGVLICNSAGNEGNDPNWNFIIAPADADSVLAIAAVDSKRTKVSFSSPGPRLDGRIKPDLAAKGSGTTLGNQNGNIVSASGTSFSSPLMAGFAAGLWQANRGLTNMQIMDYLKRSASQFNQPDGLLGYGIPNFAKAQEEIALDEAIKNLSGTDADFAVFSNPFFEATELKVLIIDPINKPAPYTWILFTETGNLVAEGTASSRIFRLNPIPELRTGLYLLKVSSINFSRTVRVLKL